MKPRQIFWIGVGIAIACVSGCASTGAPLTARQGSPAAAQQPEPPHGVMCHQYDTCSAMATIRYLGSNGQRIEKALRSTETIQKQLDALRHQK